MTVFKLGTAQRLAYSSYQKTSSYNKIKSTFKYGTLQGSKDLDQLINSFTKMRWAYWLSLALQINRLS